MRALMDFPVSSLNTTAQEFCNKTNFPNLVVLEVLAVVSIHWRIVQKVVAPYHHLPCHKLSGDVSFDSVYTSWWIHNP